MSPAQYAIVAVFAILFVLIFRHHFWSFDVGERVDCSPDRCKTVRDKLDRLCDLACFQHRKVNWRTFFITSTLVALFLQYSLRKCCTGFQKDQVTLFFTLFFPIFFVQYVFSNYENFHGPSRDHTLHALRLRLELERV